MITRSPSRGFEPNVGLGEQIAYTITIPEVQARTLQLIIDRIEPEQRPV
jgi:hypothetical protein